MAGLGQRVVPLTPQVLETLRQHQWKMEHLGVYDPYGLVFVTPTSHTNIYDHLVGRVWHRWRSLCVYSLYDFSYTKAEP